MRRVLDDANRLKSGWADIATSIKWLLTTQSVSPWMGEYAVATGMLLRDVASG